MRAVGLEVAVLIPRVTKEDEGKLVLTWSSDSTSQGPQRHAQLTQTVLHVTEKPRAQSGGGGVSVYIYVGIAGGVLLAVAAIAVALVILAVVRRAKRPPQEEQHPSESISYVLMLGFL